MDFDSILNTANKNAKKVSKTLNDLDSEVAKEKRAKLRELEREKQHRLEQLKKKRESAPRREPTPEKKFTIPKKRNEESAIDKNRIQAYLAKKEDEKRQLEKSRQAEKDRLIQLRLQTHGGKANKKIGRQFGLNPVDMQIRYGNDHEHVEKLQKQMWRDEEEQERLTDHYRDGVYKALAVKKKVEEKFKQSTPASSSKQPHRVATSKSNSLAGLSSRHAHSKDNFSPPPESSKTKLKQPAQALERKKRPAPIVDFQTLMQDAAKKVNPGNDPSPPKRMKEEIPRNSKSTSSNSVPPQIKSAPAFKNNTSRPDQKSTSQSSSGSKFSSSDRDRHVSSHSARPVTGSQFSRPPISQSSKSREVVRPKESSADPDDKQKKTVKGRFVKGPTPPPMIPPPVPGKRYLPGDVRYQGSGKVPIVSNSAPASSSLKRPVVTERNRMPEKSSHRDAPTSSRPVIKSKQNGREIDRPTANKDIQRRQEREKEAERMRRKRDERDLESIEKIRKQERLRAEQRMSLVERERERDRQRRRSEYSDDGIQEDEDYDSEMDDFIDDSGLDMDEISRQEFEETLKMVNPKYNKKKWHERERQIDDRSMIADYRTIAREEARSAKLGFMEDYYEATKHKSEAL